MPCIFRYAFALSLACLCASIATAQTSSSAPSPEAAQQADVAPLKPPAVSDPMLSPPPAAARELRSWDEALRLLRAQSPDYLSSRAGLERAAAQIRIAQAAALPTLNAQGAYTHQFLVAHIPFGNNIVTAPPPNVLAATAVLNWPILNLRALHGIGTAERNRDATSLAFEAARRDLALALVGAMLSTLAAAHVAELNRVGLRSALERAALTEARLQYGQGTPLDVDRAAQDVAAARAALISGDEALTQAREAFGLALGSARPLAGANDLDLTTFEAAVARSCRLNTELERRPDVAAARVRLEIAKRGVEDAQLMFAPSLNLASQAGYATAVTLGPKATWNLQGQLNLPLYDGGVRYGALRDARAAVIQAREALIETRLEALVSAAQTARSVSVLTSSRDVARQERDLAARIDQRTRSGYAQGFGTSLDLVLSAQALRQAETNLILLEFQVGRARADAVLENAECMF